MTNQQIIRECAQRIEHARHALESLAPIDDATPSREGIEERITGAYNMLTGARGLLRELGRQVED